MKAPQDSVDGFDSHMVHPSGFGYCFPGGNVSIGDRVFGNFSLLSPPIKYHSVGWSITMGFESCRSNGHDKGVSPIHAVHQAWTLRHEKLPIDDGSNPSGTIPASTTPMINITTTEACRQKGQDFSFSLSFDACPYYSHGGIL